MLYLGRFGRECIQNHLLSGLTLWKLSNFPLYKELKAFFLIFPVDCHVGKGPTLFSVICFTTVYQYSHAIYLIPEKTSGTQYYRKAYWLSPVLASCQTPLPYTIRNWLSSCETGYDTDRYCFSAGITFNLWPSIQNPYRSFYRILVAFCCPYCKPGCLSRTSKHECNSPPGESIYLSIKKVFSCVHFI